VAEHAVVLFDGICNLCNWSVQFIIKRDPGGYFRFAPMQSDVGRRLLEMHGFRPKASDTFILIEEYRCLTKSDAAITVAKHLTGLWPVLRFLTIIPKTVRNWCYDVVARNRYRWFGKKETCMIPSRELLDRFIQ
jgi:predicted DCC family thiol-disulfide oxidoreductase YuxK